MGLKDEYDVHDLMEPEVNKPEADTLNPEAFGALISAEGLLPKDIIAKKYYEGSHFLVLGEIINHQTYDQAIKIDEST